MARFVRLSYEIGFRHPGWPGNYTYEWEPVSSIERGDVANFGILHLLDHFDVPLERFVYERPMLVDAPKQDRELVSREELEAHDERLRNSDIVMIRTGWSDVRDPDPIRYAAEGPGVSPEACEYLSALPELKAVGLDFISLAAYRKIDPEGILAHQILCGVGRDRYVIIVEDIDLSAYPSNAHRVYAIPLFPEGADSSPCTVFAEMP
jgi:kynurenine formamidase